MNQESFNCPLCGESDFDKVGLSLHYQDCEVAAETALEYRKKKFEEDCIRAEKLISPRD